MVVWCFVELDLHLPGKKWIKEAKCQRMFDTDCNSFTWWLAIIPQLPLREQFIVLEVHQQSKFM